MPGIDLHVHTFYSDGTFSQREVLSLARERGLDILAITDHDTTDGLAETVPAAAELGIEVVPGTEFSTVWNGEGVHVLAYFIELEHPEFVEELKRLREDRFSRGERMVARLQELGY